MSTKRERDGESCRFCLLFFVAKPPTPRHGGEDTTYPSTAIVLGQYSSSEEDYC